MKNSFLAIVWTIGLIGIGCAIVSTEQSNPSTSNPPSRSSSFLEVTEVWGISLGLLGTRVNFEVVATSEAEVGGRCELQMWSGKKAYEAKSIVLKSSDLKRGATRTVSFDVDGQDKISATVRNGEELSDVVRLELQCYSPTPVPPTPTPSSTPPPTPVPPTPTPTPTPLPTPDPQVVFPPLAERFNNWRSQWIGTYGEPPYSITGTYSSSLTIDIPMCGVVIGHSGSPGYLGFDSTPSATLGHQEIALAGGHVLKGSGFNNRGYTLDIRPPEILGQGSVTTEYNDELSNFLDLCGG